MRIMAETPGSYAPLQERFPNPLTIESFGELEERAMQALTWLYTMYGVPIVDSYDKASTNEDLLIHHLTGKDAQEEEFYEGLLTLAQELAKYPQEYIRLCYLRKIVLVSTIEDTDDPTRTSHDNAGVSTGDGNLYIALGDNDIRSIRQTIHHELEHRAYHVILAEQSELEQANAGRKRPPLQTQTEWHALHQRFDLGYTDDWTSASKPEGFANEYGSSSREEDCATIMEYLMTNPKGLAVRCTNDPVLAEKVVLMKQELYWRSNGVMDDEYFQKLAQLCDKQRAQDKI